VCASVRVTVDAHEAGVETHPDFRGRGQGARAVAAWATLVRESGAVPLYSTSWSNEASRRLASRLGLVQFGSDLHIT
jgi:predicted GNAT family acetyltransferase